MASESISLWLPRSADAAGRASDLVNVLAEELRTNEKLFEPPLMRRGGGWLEGPVTFEVMSTRIDGPTVVAEMRISYRTHCVMGCGTSAVANDGQVVATLQLDQRTAEAVVRFRD